MGGWLLLIALQLLQTASALVGGQDSQRIDPYQICRNPEVELRNIKSTQLEAYTYLNNQAEPDLQERFSKRPLLLPRHLLRRGFSNHGEPAQILSALQKLIKGEPVTVVALGGSVSAGHGVLDPQNGWVSQFFAWIQKTFPQEGHVLLNRAIPAVTSGYVSGCVPELVPRSADLVLLEFTYNDNVFGGTDSSINNAARRGLERLLRRLLSHPHHPGILYLHYWPAARFQAPFLNNEDPVDAILKYYGIPSLSMRDALHPLLEQQPALLDELWWPSPDPKIHPTCIGARMMVDLVIGYLQYLLSGIGQLDDDNNLYQAPVQPPVLLQGNWQHNETACVLEQSFEELVTSNKGWKWTDEGKTMLQHKRGFISLSPGDELELDVPLHFVMGLSGQFLVGIGGLISYQHMGMMGVHCTEACTCKDKIHDMFHSQEFSMTGWRYLNVTKVREGRCTVKVTNLEQTRTGENKLKISSLMISSKGARETLVPSHKLSTNASKPEVWLQEASDHRLRYR